MRDRGKLKKLVQIIEDLLNVEGNQWLVDELLLKIEQSATIEEISNYRIIKNINEYCIEQKIKQQAIEFYKNFSITKIKDQLIQDYRRMEHERRRDSFEGFCLNMFQQLEGIVNFLFETKYTLGKLQNDRNASAFITWNKEKAQWVQDSEQRLIPFLLRTINPERNKYSISFNPNSKEPFYSMQEATMNQYFDKNGYPNINYHPNRKSWEFLSRFRTVLFYHYFDGKTTKQKFDAIFKKGHYLYTMRNQNHRGSKSTASQAKILAMISGEEAKYYFYFYGFLENFTREIEVNLKNQNTE